MADAIMLNPAASPMPGRTVEISGTTVDIDVSDMPKGYAIRLSGYNESHITCIFCWGGDTETAHGLTIGNINPINCNITTGQYASYANYDQVNKIIHLRLSYASYCNGTWQFIPVE